MKDRDEKSPARTRDEDDRERSPPRHSNGDDRDRRGMLCKSFCGILLTDVQAQLRSRTIMMILTLPIWRTKYFPNQLGVYDLV